MAIRAQPLQQARAASSLTSPNCRLADNASLLASISDHLGKSMGGSSGVLLAIMFAAAGQALKAGGSLPAALQAGLTRMKEIGGAKTGDRTMIDALEPALAALAGGKSLASAASCCPPGCRCHGLHDARRSRALNLCVLGQSQGCSRSGRRGRGQVAGRTCLTA